MKALIRILFLALAISSIMANPAMAQEIRVAVASNFSGAIHALAHRFEIEKGYRVTLIFGSTGKHYAQIKNGAPFDLFFAADIQRPKLLDEEGIAVSESRFTYAIGKLVLWSPVLVDSDEPIETRLQRGDFQKLAIANPRFAPYGKAAQEVLEDLGLWENFQRKIVRGENISQAFQFVKSGNAAMGFVALSQLKQPELPVSGAIWDVPETLYTPIEQQAVLLKNSEAAAEFLSFVKSAESLEVIRGFGYSTP